MDIRTTSYTTKEVPNKLVNALISHGFGVSPGWEEIGQEYLKWIYENVEMLNEYHPSKLENSVGILKTCLKNKTKITHVELLVRSIKNNSGGLEKFAKEYTPTEK